MNLIVGTPIWLVVILMLALAAAAIEDGLRFRISNITCAVVFIGALVAMGLHGFPLALWQNVATFIALLVVGTVLFSAGWLGGGDIKLLAAVGLWLDFKAVLGLLVTVCLAGGLLGLIYITARHVARGRSGAPKKYSRVPYGLAIVFGALFMFGTQLSQRPTNAYIDHLHELQAAQARSS